MRCALALRPPTPSLRALVVLAVGASLTVFAISSYNSTTYSASTWSSNYLKFTTALSSMKTAGGPTTQASGNIMVPFRAYHERYCVAYNYWAASKLFDDRIAFVVHATPNYLDFLEEHVRINGNFMYLSLLGPYMDRLHFAGSTSPGYHCYRVRGINTKLESLRLSKATGQVSVHLFYEKADKSKNLPCKTLTFTESELAASNIRNTSTPTSFSSIYPINVARNIARRGARNRLFISGDIENLFSANYEERMRALANDVLIEKKKLVLVHRRFEIAEDAPVPATKAQLRELFMHDRAVVFHHKFYGVGHSIPGLDEWFAQPENFENTTISQTVAYLNSEWEPQFVGDQSIVPYHDEAFPFRMRSNTHLGLELCRARFRFGIVDDLFTVHKGIKTGESANEKAATKYAKGHGYKHVICAFMARMDEQYPSTKQSCPLYNTHHCPSRKRKAH